MTAPTTARDDTSRGEQRTGRGGLVRGVLRRVRPVAAEGHGDVATSVLLGWYGRKGGVAVLRGFAWKAAMTSRGGLLFVGARARISYPRRITVGRGVSLGAGLQVNAFSQEGVVLGDRVTIRENAWIQCSSDPARPGVGLEIGEGTYIGPSAIIGVGGPIVIGRDCQIGAGCTMIAENHAVDEDGAPSAHEVVRRGIVVGDGCWIGHRAVLLDGVTLGANTIVGAGAVVTKSFPAGSRIAGVPARVIGSAS